MRLLSPNARAPMGADAARATPSFPTLAPQVRKANPPSHTYEPRTQSVATIRAWEKRTGKTFASLSYDERVDAQAEMVVWQRQQDEQGAAVCAT